LFVRKKDNEEEEERRRCMKMLKVSEEVMSRMGLNAVASTVIDSRSSHAGVNNNWMIEGDQADKYCKSQYTLMLGASAR
jgi:hypothetical protein